MAKKGHTEDEILRVLREAEPGATVVEICRKHAISRQSFYLWKRKYAGLGLSELQSCTHPLLRQCPFELGHGADDLEHQPGAGRAEVKVVAQGDERDAVSVEGVVLADSGKVNKKGVAPVAEENTKRG